MDWLTKAKAEIAVRIREKLPAALIEHGIRLHASQGLRRDCDCDFCMIKWRATMAQRGLGRYVARQCHVNPPRPYYTNCSGQSWEDEVEDAIRLARQQTRKEFRKLLNHEKTRIIF
jgi:hypothetical protein